MARILVAEDNEIAGKVIIKYLRKIGHEATLCLNGVEAMKILDADPDYDLLITDMMMPEMDGHQLIRELRRMSEFEDLPIIAVSAYVSPEALPGLFESSSVVFIPKPIKFDLLEHHIDVFLPEKENLAMDEILKNLDPNDRATPLNGVEIIGDGTDLLTPHDPSRETLDWLSATVADEINAYQIHQEIAIFDRHLYEALWQYADLDEGSPLGRHIEIKMTWEDGNRPHLHVESNSPFGKKLIEGLDLEIDA